MLVIHVLAKESWSDHCKYVVSFTCYQDHLPCSPKLSVIVLSVAAAATTTRVFSAKVRRRLATLKQEAHTAVYRCFQETHAVPATQKRRRGEKVSVEGGLKEVLDDDDPRRPERPIVEYVRPALLMS